MKKVELVIVCIVLFVVTGCVAYVIETIWYRSKGKMGRNESLAEHYKKIDQKQGNVAAAPVTFETVVENSHLGEWKFRFWREKDTVNEMGQQSMVHDPEPTLEVSFQDLFDSISKWNPVEVGPSSSVAPSSAP